MNNSPTSTQEASAALLEELMKDPECSAILKALAQHSAAQPIPDDFQWLTSIPVEFREALTVLYIYRKAVIGNNKALHAWAEANRSGRECSEEYEDLQAADELRDYALSVLDIWCLEGKD